MSFAFLPLEDSRLDESFDLLNRVARWLERQGRKQRIAQVTLPTYQQWQSERTNYVVMENDQIVGIATLRKERLDEWPEFQSLGPVYLIRALATHPDHRGKGIGEFAVNEAIKCCTNQSHIYLDCVNDFLPSYYMGLGFEVIAQQHRLYSNNDSFSIVLMRKKIQQP